MYQYLVAGTLALLTLLAGCRPAESIKVGFAGNISGPSAYLGVDARDGVLLAVEEINARGGIKGRQLELVIQNDQGDPATAQRVDQALMDAGVVAIVGHVLSSMTSAVLPLINEKKMLMITPTSVSDIFTGKDDYLIRLSPSAKEVTRRFATFARLRVGSRRMALIYDQVNKAYAEDWTKNFSEAFEKGGGRIAIAQALASGTDSDFEGHAKRLLETKPDGIAIVANAVHAVQLCQQVRRLDPDIPLFVAGWAMTQEFLDKGGAAAEGAYFSYSFDRDSTAKAYLTFRTNYEKRFGRSPDFAAKFSYESLQVLAQTLESTAQWSGVNLKKAIISRGSFTGLQGAFKIDAFGDVEAQMPLFAVRKNAYKRIE